MRRGTVNPYIRLPRAALYSGRQDFVLERCAGKRTLHVGCVDAGLLEERFRAGELLHQRLAGVTPDLWGVDVDADGIDFLRRNGFSNLYVSDASSIGSLPDIRSQEFDVVVATELLEHLSNPGLFLDSVHELMRPGRTELVITVPNAFRVRTLVHLLRGVEFNHPDHNFWFSYHTITNLVRKHGFELAQVAAYTFHPGGRLVRAAAPGNGRPAAGGARRTPARLLMDTASRVVFPVLYRTTPFWGDGIIVVARAPAHRT